MVGRIAYSIAVGCIVFILVFASPLFIHIALTAFLEHITETEWLIATGIFSIIFWCNRVHTLL